jgi:hypothetical protein
VLSVKKEGENCMSPNRGTFRDDRCAREYLKRKQPLPHEHQPKVSLLKRIQRKGLLNKFQLRSFLPDKHGSITVSLNAGLALALQSQYGCEFACDIVIELNTRRAFYLTTRGFDGAAISDELCYYLCSSHFLVLPGFHTHQRISNELGRYKPSVTDYIAIGCQQRDMGSFKLRLALKSARLMKDSRRTSTHSRWWRNRWKRNPCEDDDESGYPFVSLLGMEEKFKQLSHCLRTLEASVYFPNGQFTYYALRSPGRGFARLGVGRLWRPAW